MMKGLPRRPPRQPANVYPLLASEREWQAFVIQYAQIRGWWVYHTLHSQGSQAGFPDLVLIRGPQLIWAELKSERGRLSPTQRMVAKLLLGCHQEYYLWRPSDQAKVMEILE